MRRDRSLSLQILLVTVLLAGCVDQKREVEQYRQVLDAHIAPATAPSPTETLTLDRAMALANRNNEQLGLGGEDYVQSLIDKNRAVAAFLPTVSLQPSFVVAQRPAGPVPGGLTSGTSTAYRVRGDTLQKLEVPVVGNINVFRGFGDVANLKSAEATIAQRRDLLLDLQATVLLNVAQTYFQVLRSESQVAVLTNSLQVQSARLADVEQQFRNGLATRLSVAQSRAQVDGTQVTLLQAQSDVRNGRTTLAFLIGLPSISENPLVDQSNVPDDPGSESLYEQRALEQRQDLLAAQMTLEGARHTVDAAIAEYYPSVSINVAGFLYREFYADASKWEALLTANLPIFSAGLIEADVRTAWSRLRQAALNESEVRRSALRDVQIAYENLMTSQRRIRELRDEVQSAEEAYNQARDAYRNGLAINLDVITAQDQLLQAQLQLTSNLFDRTVFYLDLIRAAGGLAQMTPASTTQPTTTADAH